MAQEFAPVEIIVNAAYNPLAFVYAACTPTITVNGAKHRLPWGTHRFEVPSGGCEVSVSYPWLLAPECGRSTIRFRAEPGESRTVTYCAHFIRYVPGKISIE